MSSWSGSALRVWLVTVLGAFAVSCSSDGDGDSGGSDNAQFSMITPYVDAADMGEIHEAYSATDNCPWGFQHSGIDFTGGRELAPFQAVCAGTIARVELRQYGEGLWLVEVRLRFNGTFSVAYAFEPMSASDGDGQYQLSQISVREGQTVAPGDVLGRLHMVGFGAHVDFGVLQDGERVSPEPFFTPDAHASVLSLIRRDHPDWVMSY